MKNNLLSLLSMFLVAPALLLQPVIAEEARTPASTTENVAESDHKFVTKALEGGMAEVKLGKLASEKGSREDVKKFGQRMVDDHGKAGAELQSIAKKKGIAVPAQLSAKDSKRYDKLSKLGGDDFDKAYIDEMVEDHKHDVDEFEKAATKLKDPDLKAFAEKTLPVLKSHLENITEIKKSEK
jgi:putative membrane protein